MIILPSDLENTNFKKKLTNNEVVYENTTLNYDVFSIFYLGRLVGYTWNIFVKKSKCHWNRNI